MAVKASRGGGFNGRGISRGNVAMLVGGGIALFLVSLILIIL